MPGLLAYLGLDANGFHAGLRQSVTVAKSAGSEIKSSLGEAVAEGIGAFAAGALVKSLIETASRIHQLSEEFRVSTDTIQIWDRGAEKVGMTADDIGNAFNKLKKSRDAALAGSASSGKFRDAFGQFGIGLDELKNSALSTEEIMERMRAAAAAHPITDQEDVAGMELMGRGGAKVLSAMEQIHALGPIKVIDKADIEELHRAEESLKTLKRDATIGAAKTVGIFAKLSRAAGATFEGISQFVSGKMSLNEARKMSHEAFVQSNKEAAGETPKEDKQNVYTATKVVDLNKDAAQIEKLRDELARRILETQLKGMTVLERHAALKKEIAEHEKAAISARFGEGDEKKALEEDLEVQRLKGQLRIDRKAERLDFNASEKIGAFSNVSALHSMDHAAKTADNTAKAAQHLAAIAKVVTSSHIGKPHANIGLGTWHLQSEAVRFD